MRKPLLLAVLVVMTMPTLHAQQTPTLMTIQPSPASSATDFDFLVGKWRLQNRKLKSRLTNSSEWEEFQSTQEMHKILNGLGNTDNFISSASGEYFEGMTLRLFDPKTKLWSIYWADSNVGKLDVPVTGSFEKSIGRFYTTDVYNGKKIDVVFEWDKTDPDKPVWRQAFSPDGGKTWEWNWYMYFTRADEDLKSQQVNVLELRNYQVQPGTANAFSDYFEEHFAESQKQLNAFLMGRFSVTAVPDRFYWMRGFTDMNVRVNFLKAFYLKGNVWKTWGSGANKMIVDSDSVLLLKPMITKVCSSGDFTVVSMQPTNGITTIDYYIAKENTFSNLTKGLTEFYSTAKHNPAVERITFWSSEMTVNDFPRLPVVQNKNLVVVITYYKPEASAATAGVFGATSAEKSFLQDHHHLILNPTKKNHD